MTRSAARILFFLSIIVLAAAPTARDAAATESYDLSRAVERALEANFTIEAAEAGARAAEEGVKAARGAFGPALGTRYGWQQNQHKKDLNGKAVDDELYTWTVYLKQNVFSGFATLSNYQKAQLQEENAGANRDRARLALIATVQENFLLLLQARENVRSAQDSYDRLASQLKATKAFYDVGMKPRLDVLQAEVDVATAENILLQARNDFETRVARMNTLLVIGPDEAVEYTGELGYIPFGLSFEECLNIAATRRPDLRMAKKSVEIAMKDTQLAESGFYPRINAEGTWSTQGDEWNVSGSAVKPRNFSSWSVGITGEWELFSWGTDYYGSRQAKQNESRLKAEENNLRQEVVYEIKSRLLKLDEAEKRIIVVRKGLEQAKEAYRMAAARYQSQVGIFLDVLDAQAKLTAAEVALTGAQADYMVALSDIYAAIGLENPGLQGAGGA
ncbi:TolC family protein [Desulfovibrio sp. OttesenSCG-928-I05]|nr:TolC family protein [Desulfovibrio sp. OttesenSCG-928-I05]